MIPLHFLASVSAIALTRSSEPPEPPVTDIDVSARYRYHRLYFTGSHFGGTNHIGLAEIRFFDWQTDTYRPVAVGVDGSDFFTGLPPANAFDGSTATYWNSGNGTLQHQLWAEFTEEVTVKSVVISVRTSGTAWPTDFDIVTSEDGVTWDVAQNFTEAGWSTGETRQYDLTGTATSKFIGLQINDTDDGATWCALTEVDFLDTDGNSHFDIEDTGYTVSASSQTDGADDNAVDANPSTFWATGSGGLPHWFKIDWGVGKKKRVTGVQLTVRGDSFRQDPSEFTLQGSHDNTTWVDLAEFTSIPAWSAGETRTFSGTPINNSLDPLWDQVTFLSGFTDIDLARPTDVDEGPLAKTNAWDGAATADSSISVTESVFGGSAYKQIHFASSGNDDFLYYDNTHINDLFPDTGEDFTWEGFVYHDNFAAVGQTDIIACFGSSGNRGYILCVEGGDFKLLYATSSTAFSTLTWDTSIVEDEWYHFALTKSGLNIELFINGVSQGTQAASAWYRPSGPEIRFGSHDSSAGNGLGGYLDEIRMTKAVRYVDDFAVPTEPYPRKKYVAPPAVVNFRIPPWRVPSDLTAFPVAVDLADMDATFWEDVDELGDNVRVITADGTRLPLDLTYFDKSAHEGRLFFKSDLSASVANEFQIYAEDSGTKAADDNEFGRDAVWADFTAVYAFSSLEDRTGNGADATLIGTASTFEYEQTSVGSDVGAHQGVAYDGTFFYVADTNEIVKYNSSWAVQATQADPIDAAGLTGMANHCGDPCIHGGELFIPIEQYPNSPYDAQWVCVFDPSDLSFIRKYDISSEGHEVSSITYDATNGYFVITDYTSAGYTVLHTYNTSFVHQGTISIPSTEQMQGIVFYDDFFWITTNGKKLYKMALDGSARTVAWTGAIDGYMEGIDVDPVSGDLFILFDGSPSAVYTFEATDSAGPAGWLNLSGAGNAKTSAVAELESWTIGASYIPEGTVQGAVVSYTEDASANTTRATLVQRSGTHFGIWNSTDSWFDPGDALANIGSEYRLHMTHDGTTERELFYHGYTRGADSPIARRPGAATTPVLYIGAEDADQNERVEGSVNYVYLRGDILSADWILFEALNWVNPRTVYEVIGNDANPTSKVDFTNPSADTDVSGWTVKSGSGPVRTTTRGLENQNCFSMGNQTTSYWTQTLAVPSEQNTPIDAGEVSVKIGWWQEGYDGDLDNGAPVIFFLDGSDDMLGARWHEPVDVAGDMGGWKYMEIDAVVPEGTRKVEFGFVAIRVTGIEISQYVTHIGPMVFYPTKDYTHEQIVFAEGDSTSGATSVSGTLNTYVNSEVWDGASVFLWDASASGEFYFEADVSSDSAVIAAGGCKLQCFVMHNSCQEQDSGYQYVEFYDASDTLIGSRVQFADQVAAPEEGTPRYMELDVPTDTDSIRIGSVGTRVSGTSLDSYTKWMGLNLLKPR
jgi:hypothetical protein